MAKVTTTTGDVLDVTSQGALAYYRREPGYTVDDPADSAPVATAGDGSGEQLPPLPDDAYPPDATSLDEPDDTEE